MHKGIIIVLTLILLLTGCGESKKQVTEDGKEILVLASFGENQKINEQVEAFNQKNKNYKIEIKRYERSEQPEDDGIAQLQREIMSGEGPDIIDFGWGYTVSDIAGKYTEDLLPYIKNMEEQEDITLFPNILESFYYRNGLYAMPISFTLETFAGRKDKIENLNHWSIQELIACYEEIQDDMMLYPGETKKDVFATILTGCMEYYIDWETGECSFNGEEFKKIMEFSNTFPDTLQITEDFSVEQAFINGDALLIPLRLNDIYSTARTELIFNENEVIYIGFPVEGECGTVIKPSEPMLAISINSQHKEMSWEFIKQFLEKSYQSELEDSFSIYRSVLEEKLMKNREPEYTIDAEGNQIKAVKAELMFEGTEPMEIYCVTKKQADELLHLIESATICTTTDHQLYNVFLEEADSYFRGDKTLEEAVAVMQSRASIYVGEKVN
ncbi:MAG: extracellular solute-binding protein [Lachnospiraceae bacterium]|nr:extracellular solute-binding protein [Lachnospiraceae bacterium]